VAAADSVDSAPDAGQSVPWHRAIRNAVSGAVKAALTPHKASVKRLGDIPLTVVGTGGIDFSAFHVNHGVGFLVLGVSLWVIEHLIADEDEPPGGAT